MVTVNCAKTSMTPSPLYRYWMAYLAYRRRVQPCRPPVTFPRWLLVIYTREVRVRNAFWAGKGYQRLMTKYQLFGEDM
jgi:hypothetical protein